MISLLLLLLLAGSAAAQAPGAPRWYKGNTHVHTLASDGDIMQKEIALVWDALRDAGVTNVAIQTQPFRPR